MSKSNSKSSLKSIEELRRELNEMHKQLDNLTTSQDDSKNLINNELNAKTKEKIKVELPNKEDIVKADIVKADIVQEINEPLIEEKTVKLVTEIDELQKKSEIENLKPQPKTNIQNKIETSIEITEIKNEDNLDESYLSIKDKLEKIKTEIEVNDDRTLDLNEEISSTKIHVEKKETTINVEKPTISNKIKKNKKSSNALTITILILIIAILFSVYIIFI